MTTFKQKQAVAKRADRLGNSVDRLVHFIWSRAAQDGVDEEVTDELRDASEALARALRLLDACEFQPDRRPIPLELLK